MTENKTGQDSNIIFVGDKPLMNYVTGIIMQMTTKNSNEVIVKARGKYISRAVDIAEVTKRKFLETQPVEVSDIKIGSEGFENKEGRKINVSFVEITLTKK